ncbi:MAG TPA: cob(I)yrinic acid a,c-diamide adenosyltransferase [Planctomycetota bacterium]|nr:cob(I)yrinic acid a,c-diamide adenosyltransferase [Planctomycetota bacterium]
MPIYTGTGDDGSTGLFGNRRVPKDHLRIEAYGTIDELNSFLGLLRSEALPAGFDRQLETIQATLFDIGADLATEGGRACLTRVEPGSAELERWIDASEATLPQLRTFVLPGGCRNAALLHVLRTVARRAERRYWSLARDLMAGPPEHAVPAAIGIYLNRLSDLFFSWARRANHEAGVPDVPWSRTSRPTA